MAMPTTGALLINPRKRRRPTKRKPTKRKNTRRVRKATGRTTAAKRSTAAKKAAATRRRNAAARSRAAKKAAATRRRNGTKTGMRRRTARKAYAKRRTNGTKTGMRRRTARKAYAKRRPVRKAARRNPRRKNPNMITGLSQSVKGIPVIGGFASDAVALGIPALFGAISIEPVMMGLKFGGQYIPAPLQKMSFTIGGLVMGALVKNLKFIGTPELRKQFAVAVATAGGAVDYYRWKTGQGTVTAMAAAEKAGWGELEIESLEELDGLGELELAVDGWGELEIAEDMDGFGDLELAVDGFGDYDEDDLDGWAGWGAVESDYEDEDDDDELDGFGDISLADAEVSGDDMSEDEIGVFLGAPMARAYLRRSVSMAPSIANVAPRIGLRASTRGAQRQTQYYYRPGDLRYTGRHSQSAGTFGGRWFWLIKVIGYQKARQVAMLPVTQRKAYIARLRTSASRVHQLRMARSTGQHSSPMYATA